MPAWAWFVAVGVVLVVGQLLFTDLGRAPAWDEAVYLSQVDPNVPTLPFAASRARGIVVLVAPFVAAGLPLTAIRAILVVGSSAALVAAAAVWAPIVGTRIAAAAAAAFGATWLVLFYGGEVMPNLWTAILLLAAAGLFARGIAGGRSRPSWPSLALLAGAAAFRPIDAVIAALAISLVALRRDADLPWVFGVPAAALAGMLPWLVEMSVRFGGPLGAVREAAAVGHVEGTSFVDAARVHLGLVDGPLLGPDAGSIPVIGVLWWAGVLWLGAWYGGRAAEPTKLASRVAFAGGAGVLVVYLVGVDGSAPRFLLPAIALLVMAAAAGTTALPPASRIAVGLAAIGWIVVQLTWLGPIDDDAVAARAAAQAAGMKVRELAGPGDCMILATVDQPQLGYASGCHVRRIAEGEPLDAVAFEPPAFFVTRGGGALGDVMVAGYAITELGQDAGIQID